MATARKRTERPECLVLWQRLARLLERPRSRAALVASGVSGRKVAELRAHARQSIAFWEALWAVPLLRPSLRKLDRRLVKGVREAVDAGRIVERERRELAAG